VLVLFDIWLAMPPMRTSMSLTIPAGIVPLADAFELVTLELASSPALIALPTLPAAVPAPLGVDASAESVVPLRVHVWTAWLSVEGIPLAMAIRDVSGIDATAVVEFVLASAFGAPEFATPTRMERVAGLAKFTADREPGIATFVLAWGTLAAWVLPSGPTTTGGLPDGGRAPLGASPWTPP